MKRISCVLGMLFAVCVPVYSQTGVNGTWQVDGVGMPFPWQVVLRADGARLTGMVSQCASGPNAEISEGSIDGSTIRFKCKRADGVSTISFTGRIKGDEIAFGREIQIGDGFIGTDPRDGMFGSSAPPQFVAKRVADGRLAELAGRTRGMQLYAAVNLPQKDVKAAGTLFLPEKVSRVRTVIVVVRYGVGISVGGPQWDKLSEATESGLLFAQFSNIGPSVLHGFRVPSLVARADALLLLLQRLAQDSGHHELADAPLVLWGHSAAGQLGKTLAALHPQRTAAFVLYHSYAGSDMKVISRIPALLLAGGKDEAVLAADLQEEMKNGRALGAPWVFAVDPDADHGSNEDLKKADELVIPWITAVIRQRVSPDGRTLRAVTDSSAWLGNNQTGEFVPYGVYTGTKAEASWLPDEASARGWQAVMGKK